MKKEHLFDDMCRVVFFDRHGGVSDAPYDSCNCSFGVSDAPEAVAENRRLLKERLGARILLSAVQTHGERIYIFAADEQSDREVNDYDALLTSCRGVALMIQHADCQPVFLYDKQHQVVAAVHCGWRGSVVGILGKTVQQMEQCFQSRPKELQAVIGPSLGPCCAEFRHYRQEFPQNFTRFLVAENHFDFWEISRHQLVAGGVLTENIHCMSLCTCCNNEYFSYRRACRNGLGVTGRNCSAIILNNVSHNANSSH